MFKKNKHKSESGSFKVSKFSKLYREPNAKSLIIVFGAVFFVAGLIAFGWYLLSQDENKDTSKFAFVPTAEASSVPGWWMQQYFGSSVCNEDRCKTEADPDEDKLSNSQEFYYHSDPTKKDTNGNKRSDGEDVARGIDPSKEGDMTFEEVASDDNIVGESLVFGDDIKQTINEMANPNNISLPQINDLEIVISNDNSVESLQRYVQESNDAINKEFPFDKKTYIEEAVKSGDIIRILDIKERLTKSYFNFKKISVPSQAVQLHKYGLMFLQILPEVVDTPDESKLNDEYDPEGNRWYDNTQRIISIQQKMDLEIRRLVEVK
jgi:hypothetical protein